MTRPEFRLFVSASDVPPAGREVAFEADEGTLKDLAKRFGILEVVSLSGIAKVRPYRKAGLTVEGRFKAEVVQSCVVSLEPVHQTVEESFTQRYLPEHMIAPDVPEMKEPMTGNGVDLGEAVAERLALALDPYPRKPDAAFLATSEEPGDAPESKPNPFAALEKLKKNY
jgi:uncharacterized metal-binding protein YceD (DUF177 family)